MWYDRSVFVAPPNKLATIFDTERSNLYCEDSKFLLNSNIFEKQTRVFFKGFVVKFMI